MTWDTHKHPLRYRWLLDVAGADAMGISRLPPMDCTLAFTLDSYHKKHAEEWPKSPQKAKKVPMKGYNIDAKIPFLEPAAQQAATDDRLVYET